MNQWESEPNLKRFKHKGHLCKIKRHDTMLHLCGYIGVPKGHVMYGLKYDESSPFLKKTLNRIKKKKVDPQDLGLGQMLHAMMGSYNATPESILMVHGGVTFSGSQEGSDLWWFGFDCNHYRDLAPGMSDSKISEMDGIPNEIREAFAKLEGKLDELMSENDVRMPEKTYKDMVFVTEECEKMATQLAFIGRENKTPSFLLNFIGNIRKALRPIRDKIRLMKMNWIFRKGMKWAKKEGLWPGDDK